MEALKIIRAEVEKQSFAEIPEEAKDAIRRNPPIFSSAAPRVDFENFKFEVVTIKVQYSEDRYDTFMNLYMIE